jgi:hypothetical protein
MKTLHMVYIYGAVFIPAEKLKFSPRPVNKKLELGSSARVYCKAQGALPPVIKWFKVMYMVLYFCSQGLHTAGLLL